MKFPGACQWLPSLHLPFSFYAVFFPFVTTEQQPGGLDAYSCLGFGRTSWAGVATSSSPLLSLPFLQLLLPFHAENKTISLLWDCLATIFLTHSLWQYGNMSFLVSPNGQQEPFCKQLLWICEIGWKLEFKKKKKSRFQKIQELRLKVKLFKMSKVFGIEAGVTFS